MDRSMITPRFDRKAFGKTLRSERRRRKITQEAIYDRVGVSAVTINRLEHARSGCSIDTLALIAEAMGCDLVIQFVDKGEHNG